MTAATAAQARAQAAAPAEIPSPMPLSPLAFVTEANSPWPDGYSLDGERAALADILDADGAEADPRWPRVLEFERREDEFRQKQSIYTQRKGAEAVVSEKEANSFRYLGNLVDDQSDTMMVHTLEAYRLFMGRAPSPDGKLYAIPGGKRQGAALRTLWILTGNDNPYAEWALVLHEQAHNRLAKLLADEIAECKQRIDALAERGLKIKLQVSSGPVELDLGFRSPYGYAVCELIVDYDLFVRYVKTLARKNQLTDEKARLKLRDATRQIRAAWIELVHFERFLSRAELRDLSRSDFLPTADANGQKRAEAARRILQGIPSQIFAGSLAPKHTRRRGQLSEQDRVLLLRTIQDADKAAAEDAAKGESAGNLV